MGSKGHTAKLQAPRLTLPSLICISNSSFSNFWIPWQVLRRASCQSYRRSSSSRCSNNSSSSNSKLTLLLPPLSRMAASRSLRVTLTPQEMANLISNTQAKICTLPRNLEVPITKVKRSLTKLPIKTLSSNSSLKWDTLKCKETLTILPMRSSSISIWCSRVQFHPWASTSTSPKSHQPTFRIKYWL